MKGHMTLDTFVFDRVYFFPCAVTVDCVRAKASVHPRVLYDVIMNILAKGDILEFIVIGGTNNWVVLLESRQYWFEVVVMYKTLIPCSNGMNKFQWVVIKLCAIFGE